MDVKLTVGSTERVFIFMDEKTEKPVVRINCFIDLEEKEYASFIASAKNHVVVVKTI